MAEFDALTWHEPMQSLVERMAKAKWIAGKQFVSPTQFHLNWTELGRERMTRAAIAASKILPAIYNPSSIPSSGRLETLSLLEIGNLTLEIIPLIGDLYPPKLSDDEGQCLFEMLAFFCRRNPPGSPLSS